MGAFKCSQANQSSKQTILHCSHMCNKGTKYVTMVQGHLIACSFIVHFQDSGNYLLQVIYVSGILLQHHCPPECLYPLESSSLFRGFTAVRIKCFNSCHMFSIGFRSRLSGGVRNRDTLLSLRNLSVDLEVWHGALSRCSLLSGKHSRRNGSMQHC